MFEISKADEPLAKVRKTYRINLLQKLGGTDILVCSALWSSKSGLVRQECLTYQPLRDDCTFMTFARAFDG
jgi:hypothetical protein